MPVALACIPLMSQCLMLMWLIFNNQIHMPQPHLKQMTQCNISLPTGLFPNCCTPTPPTTSTIKQSHHIHIAPPSVLHRCKSQCIRASATYPFGRKLTYKFHYIPPFTHMSRSGSRGRRRSVHGRRIDFGGQDSASEPLHLIGIVFDIWFRLF